MDHDYWWVIERHYNSVLRFWTPDYKSVWHPAWSPEIAQATKFATKADAEQVIDSLLGGWGNAVEHAWSKP